MSSRSSALPSSKKTHSEKHKLILKQLLKEAPNKVCVDCKTAKNPRWASWNLGCFFCIRCSGIHRSMGTHISKVKSIDLDAWTDEQIENMVRWGNEKCNLYWEGNLPDGYVPNELKIENFIRTKYEMAKWKDSAAKASSAVPVSRVSENSASKAATGSVSEHSASKAATGSVSHSHKPTLPTKPHSSHSKHPLKSHHSANEDLLSFSNSAPAAKPVSNSLLDDDFGSFTSSPSPSTSKTNLKSPPIQSAQSTGGSIGSIGSNGLNSRPDLKKSILSLYSSPSSSSSFIPPQPTRNNNHSANNVNNLSNSLNGLNFGNQGQGYASSNAQGNNQNQNSYNNQNSLYNTTKSPDAFNSTYSSNNASTIARNGSDVSSSNPSASNLPTTKLNPKPSLNNTWNNEWNDSGASLPNKWTGNAPATTNSGSLNVGLDDDLFKNVWN